MNFVGILIWHYVDIVVFNVLSCFIVLWLFKQLKSDQNHYYSSLKTLEKVNAYVNTIEESSSDHEEFALNQCVLVLLICFYGFLFVSYDIIIILANDFRHLDSCLYTTKAFWLSLVIGCISVSCCLLFFWALEKYSISKIDVRFMSSQSYGKRIRILTLLFVLIFFSLCISFSTTIRFFVVACHSKFLCVDSNETI